MEFLKIQDNISNCYVIKRTFKPINWQVNTESAVSIIWMAE